MRKIVVVINLLLIAICAHAEVAQPLTSSPLEITLAGPIDLKTEDVVVSIDLKEVNIADALSALFRGSGKNYTLEAGIEEKKISSISIKNMPFEAALSNVCRIAGLTYRVDDGIYIITKSISDCSEEMISMGGSPYSGGMSGYGGAMIPGMPQTSYGNGGFSTAREIGTSTPVTLDIPAMSVAEAYTYLVKAVGGDPLGWTFSDNLGSRKMAGAKFYMCDFQAAANTIIAAAGLTPPTGSDKVVKIKGWSGNIFANVYMQRYGNQYTKVAAYKGLDDVWKYNLLTGECNDSLVISTLLDVAGVSYSMANSGAAGVKMVTLRLADMTLNEAISAILEPLGRTYKQRGNLYVIQNCSPEVPKPPTPK